MDEARVATGDLQKAQLYAEPAPERRGRVTSRPLPCALFPRDARERLVHGPGGSLHLPSSLRMMENPWKPLDGQLQLIAHCHRHY